MNLRGAWALIKGTWASWLQHRGFFFLLAFGWMIPPLIYLFVWSTAAGEANGRRADAGPVYGLLFGADRGQPTDLLADQLDGGRRDPLRGDECPAAAAAVALFRRRWRPRLRARWCIWPFVMPVAAILALVLRPELARIAAQNALAFVPALALAWAAALFLGLLAGAAGFLGHARRCAAGAAGRAGLFAGRAGRADGAAARCAARRRRTCCPFATCLAFRSRC